MIKQTKGRFSICRFGTKLGSDPKLEDMMWVSLTDQLAKVIWRYQLKSVYPVHQYRTKACCTYGTVVEFVSRTFTFFRLSISVLHFFKVCCWYESQHSTHFLLQSFTVYCCELIFWSRLRWAWQQRTWRRSLELPGRTVTTSRWGESADLKSNWGVELILKQCCGSGSEIRTLLARLDPDPE